MVPTAVRSVWAEPRPAQAPDRSAGDWALVVVLVVWSVSETVLRDDLVSRPLVLVLSLAVLAPLLWRRGHPLRAVAVSFGGLTVIDLARILSSEQGGLLTSISAVVVVAYSLFRWGSGREAATGLGVILLWRAVTRVADPTSAAEVVAGYAFFLFAAALGAAVRYRATLRLRDLAQARAREREQLARELHDTVAHHVSGIAVQAQAGRAVEATDPARAAAVLQSIEEAATRALAELRYMVGVLRTAQGPGLAPQLGVADLEHLVGASDEHPAVHVAISGDLAGLSPAVEGAVYRLAQESITNARRHARQATLVRVQVRGDDAQVALVVEDDGARSTSRGDAGGYGLVGMRERAALLGGTFQAGPQAEGGWRVEAVLPRVVAHR